MSVTADYPETPPIPRPALKNGASLDPRFEQMTRHLWRGGQVSFWTFESERRTIDSDRAAERESVWFPVSKPLPLPKSNGQFGPRHFWYGVNPSIAVPATNGKGEPADPRFVRSQTATIAALNCLYSEFDAKDFVAGKVGAMDHIHTLPAKPSVLIDSGGGFHAYWLLTDTWHLTDENRIEARATQHAWVIATGGDHNAKNLNRVLRIPGTQNVKTKYGTTPPTVGFVWAEFDQQFALGELVAHIPDEARERTVAPSVASVAVNLDDLSRAAAALKLLAPNRCDDYDGWVNVGMALHELGAAGLMLWESWSRNSTKFQEGACGDKWKTFTNSGRGLGTLYYYAKQDNPGEYRDLFTGQPDRALTPPPMPPMPPMPPPPPTEPEFDASEPAPRTEPDDIVPALPLEACQIWLTEGYEKAGAWLDEYVKFASEAAPMTPRSFHQAAGLMAASVATARRLCLRASNTSIYTNLYFLFIARSSLYRKSTGYQILYDLFDRAGLRHLLLSNMKSSESMVQELSLSIPQALQYADAETRTQWLTERAFAGQRGWTLDEASTLFDAFLRDNSSGLLPLLLNLYDCPAMTTEQTVGRWRTTIRQAYLSFFGASTPALMSKHLRHRDHWLSGLWARFILITPDTEPIYQFWPEATTPSWELIEGLRRIATIFPTPTARLVESTDETGSKQKVIELDGQAPPSQAHLAPGVRAAWEAYDYGLNGISKQLPEEFGGLYTRLSLMAMKTAMLLAVMDTEELPVVVEKVHFARAQQITEEWRVSAHRVRTETTAHEDESRADKIVGKIRDAGPNGLPTREVYRALHLSAKDGRVFMDDLAKQGRVIRDEKRAANGKPVEYWRTTEAL